MWRRSRYLCAAILAGEVDDEPRPLRDLVAELAALPDTRVARVGRPRWSSKTVRNTIGDLQRFGAVALLDRGHGERVVVPTTLGRAWAAGVPLPGLEELPMLGDAVARMLADGW